VRLPILRVYIEAHLHVAGALVQALVCHAPRDHFMALAKLSYRHIRQLLEGDTS
jgi:hypothetical protein